MGLTLKKIVFLSELFFFILCIWIIFLYSNSMSRNKHDRIFRRRLLNFLKKIHIKSWGLSFSEILFLSGIILVGISFFIPWFSINSNSINNTAFSPIIWVNGYVLLCFSIISIVLLFSQNLKQKVKLFLNTSVEDTHIYMLSSLLIVLSILNSIVILNGLYIFVSQISFHWGITTGLVWGIIMLGSSLFIHRNNCASPSEYKIHTFEENNSDNTITQTDKTTKLPF